MADQWMRKASLVVAAGEEGIDLSELRFTFRTQQWDLQTPGRIYVRIFNLSDDTANRVQKEFTRLILQAGYENGEYGPVFDGTIVQVRRGRENPTDTYLDITAADGDIGYAFGVVNTTISRGSAFADRADALRKAMGVEASHIDPLPESKLPRGRTFYGQARDHMRDLAFSTDTSWSIQRGQLQIVKRDGFLPGEAVVLTSATGMIGLPEQTQDGIRIRCLLNPRIRPGVRVQIDNASIQQAGLQLSVTAGAVRSNSFLPRISEDGFYRVVVCEHEGDSRGQAWYADLICVALDDELFPIGLLNKGYS